jgi:hypothetical protein
VSEDTVTPTARSLKLLRDTGHVAGVVERWLPHANKRSDLFGFGDILAVHRVEPGVLLVQSTTLGNIAARVAKAKARPELAVWLRSGRFECWGWYLRNGRWQVKRVEVRGADLAGVVLEGPRRRRRVRPDQGLLWEDWQA